MKSKLLRLAGYVAVIFVFVSAALVGLAAYGYAKIIIDTRDWVSAPATITYTYSSQAYASRYGPSGIEFVPHPTYSFVAADGKIYSGNRYSIHFDTKRYGVTDEMLDHPTVEEGTVYYDPENPDHSTVLRPVFNPFALFIFPFVIAVLLISGIVLWQRVRRKTRGRVKSK